VLKVQENDMHQSKIKGITFFIPTGVLIAGIVSISPIAGLSQKIAPFTSPSLVCAESGYGISFAAVQRTADSTYFFMPERSWLDSHRVRKELTYEIASKYAYGKFKPRAVENKAWGVGEQLVFTVDYGFYTAGTATMSVLKKEQTNGDLCYHIQTTARSNDFISKFYKVQDSVNSFIDVNGIFSRRLEQNLSEGDYKSNRYIDFYHDRQIALSTVKKHALTEIPLYTQDVLSSLYLIRTLELTVGKDIYIDTYADGKVYPLRVTVHSIETIEVPAGKFTCYVVEPFLQSDGIFRQKGRLKVWLTKDEYKMPVKMTSKIVIGNIGTNLESYRRGTIE
jgi:hypothetical protein